VSPGASRTRRPWFALVATTIGIAGFLVFGEGQLAGSGGMPVARLSVHASILSTLLLALSAVMYVAHGVAGDSVLGRGASAFAAAGASGVVGASLVRWIEVEWLAPDTLSYAGQYEVLTWIAAIAVYLYLCIEDVYQTRIAGGVVLPSVVAALGLAAWLIATSPAPERTFMELAVVYLQRATQVTMLAVGGALSVIGTLSVARLAAPFVAGTGGFGQRRHRLSTGPLHDRFLRWAMLAGFCAVTLALMFDAAAHVANRLPLAGFDLGVPALWLDFAVLYVVWQLRRWPRDLVAWWALVAVALAGAGALTGLLIDLPSV